MRQSRYTDNQILAILKQNERGVAVPELCRKHGMSSANFYKWRAKFGGMDASLMQRLKALEEGNRRLKNVCLRATQGEDSPGDYLRESCKAISTQRDGAGGYTGHYSICIRFACVVMGISESSYYYRPKPNDDNVQIANWLLR